jgi:hypothetical protein
MWQMATMFSAVSSSFYCFSLLDSACGLFLPSCHSTARSFLPLFFTQPHAHRICEQEMRCNIFYCHLPASSPTSQTFRLTITPSPGAMLDEVPQSGASPKIRGSVMVAVAESKEAVLEKLKQDVYVKVCLSAFFPGLYTTVNGSRIEPY